MTNPISQPPIDYAELQAAIATYSKAAAGRGRYLPEGSSPYLITRREGDAFWSLTIRTVGHPISVCTGTSDRPKARYIAAAVHSDAKAGRFTSRPAPTDARTLALIEGINRAAARRHAKKSSDPAGAGQPEVRIPSSERA